MRVIWVCVGLWLGGCDTPADVKAQIACGTLCTCGPGAQTVGQCEASCIEQSDFQDACFECIQAHANECRTIAACVELCRPPPPPPDDLPDGGMR